MAACRTGACHSENYCINPATIECMKLNPFLTVIAVVLSLLGGYLVYTVADGQQYDYVAGIGGAVCFATSLIPAVAIRFKTTALNVNLKVLSVIALLIMGISQLCFAFREIDIPYYIIVNGIIVCLYLAAMYAINSTKQY